METRIRPPLGAEDRPAMVVGWIERSGKILTKYSRQLSEQDALSRILAIYNRNSIRGLDGGRYRRRTTMQTTPARSTRLSEHWRTSGPKHVLPESDTKTWRRPRLLESVIRKAKAAGRL